MDVVALELIRQIQVLDNQNEYLLFAKDGDDRNCVSDTDNFKTKILKGITYAGWEQISLPAAVKGYSPQLLHCTANTAPFSCPVPMIVTVHDIIYLEKTDFDGSAYQNFGNLYRKFVVPHVIKKARKVITVSEHEKKVISDVCKTDPDKIEVIYNGVSERFHQHFSKEETEGFGKQIDLPEKFILFLGNTAPKKNTPGVIKAYVHYCSMVNEPLPIVITDFPRSSVLSILEKLNRARLIDKIVTPGYVPSGQMPLLYNCSSLFLYPSLRESFGLPVLEAMACGVNVIASDIPAIREVAGDAAIFIDPHKHENIAEAIDTILNDQEKSNDLKQKGLTRASQFSWKSSAKKLIKLYETI